MSLFWVGNLSLGNNQGMKGNMESEGKGKREVLLRTELREVAEVNFTSFLSWLTLPPYLKALGLSPWDLSDASSHSICLLGLAVEEVKSPPTQLVEIFSPLFFLFPNKTPSKKEHTDLDLIHV